MDINSPSDDDFNTYFLEYITDSANPAILINTSMKLDLTKSIYEDQGQKTLVIYKNKNHDMYIGIDIDTKLTAYIPTEDILV
jgi:hypothetical protein